MHHNFIKAFGKPPKAFSNALYALCDIDTLTHKGYSLEKFIQVIQNKQATLVQYRNKNGSLNTQQKHLEFLKKYLDLPIIINDKIELIEYADGLHLGQEDLDAIHHDKLLAVKLVRKKIGNKLFGISTHNEVEILSANEMDLDMIGLGAYRPTSTKDVDTVLGEKLPYLAKISKHPVCAIGGVKMNEVIDNVTFNVIGSGLYED